MNYFLCKPGRGKYHSGRYHNSSDKLPDCIRCKSKMCSPHFRWDSTAQSPIIRALLASFHPCACCPNTRSEAHYDVRSRKRRTARMCPCIPHTISLSPSTPEGGLGALVHTNITGGRRARSRVSFAILRSGTRNKLSVLPIQTVLVHNGSHHKRNQVILSPLVYPHQIPVNNSVDRF